MPLLQLENITRAFGPEGERAGVFGVSLELGAGVLAVLAGPSGSGKTTLLQVAGLLDTPDGGKVSLNGRPVSHLDERARCVIRLNQVGFVFQSYNLVPVLDAVENVMLPLQLLGRSRAQARMRAVEILSRVGLANRLGHYPGQLSGGQQQRVAIARALAACPALVLADEPTASLDRAHGGPLMDLMRCLADESGAAFLVASHDPMVMERADEIFLLEDGVLASHGPRLPQC